MLIYSIILAYLIGSLNGAIIVCNFLELADPRTQGSNNPGATNMLRLHGKMPAIAAFAIDCTKAIFILQLLPSNDLIYSAAAVCLGHIFPIYHKFRGGKGVAVTVGILFSLSWQLASLAIIAWLITFKLTKISSVAAITALIITGLSAFWPLADPNAYLALIIPGLAMLISHKSNFMRLLAGQELPPTL